MSKFSQTPASKQAWTEESPSNAEQKDVQFPTFAIAKETEKQSPSILQTLRAASANLGEKFNGLKKRFQNFRRNFFNNRVAPITTEDSVGKENKISTDTKNSTNLDKKNFAATDQKTRKILVKEAYKTGLPSYQQSEIMPTTNQQATNPPTYEEIGSPSPSRPSSPPPAYSNSQTNQPFLNLNSDDQSDDQVQESSTDPDEKEPETIAAPTTTETQNSNSFASTAKHNVSTGTIATQTEPEPDGLDKLFQEYRDFFNPNSSVDKLEDTLKNISKRLESGFLLKDAALQPDGSKHLNLEVSGRLKNFLESDPTLKLGARQAIAASLSIELQANNTVEKINSAQNLQTAATLDRKQGGNAEAAESTTVNVAAQETATIEKRVTFSPNIATTATLEEIDARLQKPSTSPSPKSAGELEQEKGKGNKGEIWL